MVSNHSDDIGSISIYRGSFYCLHLDALFRQPCRRWGWNRILTVVKK